MNTTTAVYQIQVKTDEGSLSFLRTMPTRPKTQKGIKAHNTRLTNYAMNRYPNWKEIDFKLLPWQELSPLNCPYSVSTSIATPMQLTSKDGHMVVDFYPVKFHTGQIHNRLMLKVVTFCGKTQSKSYINKKDFQYEFDSRTHGYGYQVTDESMIPQFYNSGMGMAC